MGLVRDGDGTASTETIHDLPYGKSHKPWECVHSKQSKFCDVFVMYNNKMVCFLINLRVKKKSVKIFIETYFPFRILVLILDHTNTILSFDII